MPSMKRLLHHVPPTGVPVSKRDLWWGMAANWRQPRALDRFRSALAEQIGNPNCYLVPSGRAALALILLGLKRLSDRTQVVVPAYVTERLMPGVAVLHEGAWLDLDDQGVDRSGNPDMLTLDEPSPAGAFAYNTVLCDIRKTALEHRPGWDLLATSRSHVFRRDL